MPSMSEWRVPPAFQPRPGDYSFDLDEVLALIVGLHSFVPADAFTAETLGTERGGNGVVIEDGLILTIGVGLHHGQLGMQVVIEDYVGNDGWKLALIVIVKFIAVLFGLGAIVAILRIGFGG